MSKRKINTTKSAIISGQTRSTNNKQGIFAMLEKEVEVRQVDTSYLKHKPYKCDLS